MRNDHEIVQSLMRNVYEKSDHVIVSCLVRIMNVNVGLLCNKFWYISIRIYTVLRKIDGERSPTLKSICSAHEKFNIRFPLRVCMQQHVFLHCAHVRNRSESTCVGEK